MWSGTKWSGTTIVCRTTDYLLLLIENRYSPYLVFVENIFLLYFLLTNRLVGTDYPSSYITYLIKPITTTTLSPILHPSIHPLSHSILFHSPFRQ